MYVCLVSGSRELAKTEYIHSHNKAAAHCTGRSAKLVALR